MEARSNRSLLVLACGALARELKVVLRRPGLEHLSLRCLPPELHDTPQRIPDAVRTAIEEEKDRHDGIFVAYGDCGTGGRLDALLEEYGVERLPGPHCYAFYAGTERFTQLHEEELGTFYLTDFLVRHFDRLVIAGLGLDRHPELLPQYFGNYRRMVYLAQAPSPELEARARECAERLGLEYRLEATGLERFARELEGAARSLPTSAPPRPRRGAQSAREVST